MADIFSPEKRRAVMQRVKQKNTKPEVAVRSLLHAMGYRFRLHRKDLPGSPDVVLPKYKAAVFVHGCFWHGHNCRKAKLPATRREFWEAKISGNQNRDRRAEEALHALGYRVKVVWECELKDMQLLETQLRAFLSGE